MILHTEQGSKTTLRDPKVLPETVIYDVDLTMSLPPLFSEVSVSMRSPTRWKLST